MNGLQFNQLDSATSSTLDLITSPDGGCTTLVWEPLVDWLPKASQHKKYIPTWHLVRSYK